MEDTKSRLSPLYRELIESAEKKFPRASEKFCSEKEGGRCGITGEVCRLRNCPKLLKA